MCNIFGSVYSLAFSMNSVGKASINWSSLAMRLRWRFSLAAADWKVSSGLACINALTISACWITLTGGFGRSFSGNGSSIETSSRVVLRRWNAISNWTVCAWVIRLVSTLRPHMWRRCEPKMVCVSGCNYSCYESRIFRLVQVPSLVWRDDSRSTKL